jgi:hypothetical protein
MWGWKADVEYSIDRTIQTGNGSKLRKSSAAISTRFGRSGSLPVCFGPQSISSTEREL